MPRAQRFEVTVEGQTHKVVVELDDQGQPAEVQVDGAPCSVQAAADDTFLVRPGGAEGPQWSVHLCPGRRPHQASIDGEVVGLELKSAREAALDAALASSGGGAGSGTVKAPMPGRVVRVLVAEGDPVEDGTPLLIVEAMKMENDVRSPTAGKVGTILVAAGDTVDAGQLLCEIGEA